MDAFYQWCMQHQTAIALFGVPIATFIIGWALPNDKAKQLGFNISQFIRRCFGAKLEEKLEDIVDGVSQGMKSDNEGSGGKLNKLLVLACVLGLSGILFSSHALPPPEPVAVMAEKKVSWELKPNLSISAFSFDKEGNLEPFFANGFGVKILFPWQTSSGQVEADINALAFRSTDTRPVGYGPAVLIGLNEYAMGWAGDFREWRKGIVSYFVLSYNIGINLR